MAYGQANVDTIQSSTAGTPPVFKDGNSNQIGTLCRAWVNFNGVTTATIRASFNVSSVTRNSTGNYTVSFTNALPDANYSAVITSSSPATVIGISWLGATPTTSALTFNVYNLSSAATDVSYSNVAIFL